PPTGKPPTSATRARTRSPRSIPPPTPQARRSPRGPAPAPSRSPHDSRHPQGRHGAIIPLAPGHRTRDRLGQPGDVPAGPLPADTRRNLYGSQLIVYTQQSQGGGMISQLSSAQTARLSRQVDSLAASLHAQSVPLESTGATLYQVGTPQDSPSNF